MLIAPLIAALFGALVACGPQTTVAPAAPVAPTAAGARPSAIGEPGVDASSVVEAGQRLVVTVGDAQVGLKNGGIVRLGNGLTVALYLDPYPPTTLSSTLDVYLEQDGRPVDDGFVSVAYDMLAMEHGPFGANGKKIGGGHFLVALNYFMFGAWDQTLTLRAGTERVELPLIVIAHP